MDRLFHSLQPLNPALKGTPSVQGNRPAPAAETGSIFRSRWYRLPDSVFLDRCSCVQSFPCWVCSFTLVRYHPQYWFEHQNLRDERAEVPARVFICCRPSFQTSPQAFCSLLWEGVYNYKYVCRATCPGEFVVCSRLCDRDMEAVVFICFFFPKT